MMLNVHILSQKHTSKNTLVLFLQLGWAELAISIGLSFICWSGVYLESWMCNNTIVVSADWNKSCSCTWEARKGGLPLLPCSVSPEQASQHNHVVKERKKLFGEKPWDLFLCQLADKWPSINQSLYCTLLRTHGEAL